MPERILFDEAGNEVKVPDETDLTALQAAATKSADLLKELEEAKQAANPNWAEMRRINKSLEAENAKLKKLEDKGKTIDDNGEIVDRANTMSPEAVRAAAVAAAQGATTQVLIDQRVEDYLQELSTDEANVVRTYYSKLSAGEEMNVRKVDEVMKSAFQAAGIGVQENQARRTVGISGTGARVDGIKPKKEDFADTDSGKTFAANMGLRFINAKQQ